MALTTHSADSRQVIQSSLPSTNCFAWTPHDTNFLADANDRPIVSRAIMVNADGDTVLTFVDNPGAPVTIALKAGILYPFAVVKIDDTGTTPTSIFIFR